MFFKIPGYFTRWKIYCLTLISIDCLQYPPFCFDVKYPGYKAKTLKFVKDPGYYGPQYTVLTGIHLQRNQGNRQLIAGKTKYKDHTAIIRDVLKLQGFYIKNIKNEGFIIGDLFERGFRVRFYKVFTKNTCTLVKHLTRDSPRINYFTQKMDLLIKIMLPKLY